MLYLAPPRLVDCNTAVDRRVFLRCDGIEMLGLFPGPLGILFVVVFNGILAASLSDLSLHAVVGEIFIHELEIKDFKDFFSSIDNTGKGYIAVLSSHSLSLFIHSSTYSSQDPNKLTLSFSMNYSSNPPIPMQE